MTRRKHVDALAEIVERTLDAHAVPRARRLLDVELAWVEQAATASFPGKEQRRALRIRRVVETCRDEHLASLDADEGLIALGITWEEGQSRSAGGAGSVRSQRVVAVLAARAGWRRSRCVRARAGHKPSRRTFAALPVASARAPELHVALHDEPGWAGTLTVEPIELDERAVSAN